MMKKSVLPQTTKLNQVERDIVGLDQEVGTKHYRAFVGPTHRYDLSSSNQFVLAVLLGLRESDYLLDIGCGSLRGGKLFIPYLLPGRYFGIEPEKWLVEEGIKHELSDDFITLKKPNFSFEANFKLSIFERKFDYINAQSIFSHASAEQIRTCLTEVQKVLKPGGIFVVNFGLGRDDYRGDKWVYPGCVRYTWKTFHKLIMDQGLDGKLIDFPALGDLSWTIISQPKYINEMPKYRTDLDFRKVVRLKRRGKKAVKMFIGRQ